MVVPDVGAPLVRVVELLHKSFEGAGAEILKVFDVTEVNPVLVKVIVAPEIALVLVAVNPAKVVTPEIALTDVVPPNVHVPAPTAALIDAVLVVAFPY
jgi:hypothetical protein